MLDGSYLEMLMMVLKFGVGGCLLSQGVRIHVAERIIARHPKLLLQGLS